MKIQINKNEFWWGISASRGAELPFGSDSELELSINKAAGGSDQFSPLLLSSDGRFICGNVPFSVKVSNGVITTEPESADGRIKISDGHENLRGAYLAAMRESFPFDGELPDEDFFRVPQYNTWIELATEQTTENILRYAHGIIDHGLPAGVLMIDGGWQEDYGTFEFNRRKVPDPKAMIDELHSLGFKVMVWVSPIVASAGTQYKMIRDKGFLCRDKNGEIAIRKWWSGFSAVLDFTNPDAVEWYHGQLRFLMDEYGIDGFKFDAGDESFYSDDDKLAIPAPARVQTKYFNEVGVKYKLNEFRAAYDFGGRAIVSRLHDKNHTWNDHGLETLIPNTLAQGLLGYAYCCPDMVGGGEINCFTGKKELDEELFVRWAQANALMGMMQMSAAPWRVLSEKNAALVLDAIKLHAKFGGKFLALAKNAAATGEPITRHMEYVFPHKGFAKVNDQFMLGNEILAAPVLDKGQESRKVVLPEGRWEADDGVVFDGGQEIVVRTPIERIPYFVKISD